MPESCQNSLRFGTEDYSLYVTNLPFELDEDGIEKIFKVYGDVKAIIANNEGQFAFISYATYAEAEKAIRSLNGRPPLDLKVQFRRRRVDDSKENLPGQICPNFGSLSDSTIRQSSLPTSIAHSECESIPDLRLESPRNKFLARQYHHVGPMMQYPMISPQLIHYPYDNVEYVATNALWSRGSMTMDAAGRRHMTVGRGYTSYNIPEPRPKIISDIGKIYEERNLGSYKDGSAECKGHFGECMNCSRHATLCCSVCEGFYCSRACQVADWSRHEGRCARIPPLVGANAHQCQCTMQKAVEPIVEESKKEMSPPGTGDQERVEVKQQSTLRRPKSLSDNKNNDKRIDNVKIINNVAQSAAAPPPAQQQNPHVTTIHHSSIKEALISKPDLEMTKHEERNITPDTPKLQSMKKASINPVTEYFLSSSGYAEVLITLVKEPGKFFFVQKTEDAEKISQLMEKLNENIQQFMLVEKPVIGEIYGVLYDGLWYRGLLLSLDPTFVDYIDWGAIEELSEDLKQFRAIGNLADPPRFTQLIRLSDKFVDKSKNLETDSVISVKKIGVQIENDIPVITVDVLEESNSVETVVIPSSNEKNVKKPPSVLNHVTVGTRLVGQIGDIIDQNTSRVVLNFDAVIEAFEALLTPFKDDCDAIASNYVNYEPHVDDLVAVQKPDDSYWLRGYVLKCQPTSVIEIASLDEGIIITRVGKIIPLIPKYSDICIFSVIMTNATTNRASSPLSIEIGNVVEFEVTAITSVDRKNLVEVVDVTMNNDSILTTGLQMHQWTPWKSESHKDVATTLIKTSQNTLLNHQGGKEEQGKKKGDDERKDTGNLERSSSVNLQKNIGLIELQNNSKVLIQSYRNPSTIFLRSLEPQEIERCNRLIQNVAKSALTSPPLESLPLSADYVLAEFVDGNYYRAMVISAAPDTRKIKVFFIDYGDVQVTTLDKLKMMPESLMKEPCCVRKVRLYNIKSTPPTEEAIKCLAHAVASEEQFVYQFHSLINNEDHVILKSVATAGSCLNDQINHLLTPTWERGSNKKDQSSSPTANIPLEKETVSTPKGQNVVTIFDASVPTNFSLNDMESGKFDGNIGDTVSGLLLDTNDPGYKYVFAPEDAEMIVHLTSVMPEMMKKYSESTSHYIPRNTELCIALYEDGNWYRGCCVNAKASLNSALIFFLDFGNFATVSHTDLRAMTKDFLKPKAFGCICNVEGFTEPSTSEVSPQVLARLKTLLVQNEIYKVEIVGFCEEEYQIKLPEIRAKLVEEGLLSP